MEENIEINDDDMDDYVLLDEDITQDLSKIIEKTQELDLSIYE